MYKKTDQDEIHNHILHQDYVHLRELKTQLFALLHKQQQLRLITLSGELVNSVLLYNR